MQIVVRRLCGVLLNWAKPFRDLRLLLKRINALPFFPIGKNHRSSG
jgi:hypothetical protein